ncbi:hypothetical protein K1W54_04885 [Micromonospora sp. CPCC 205371]|nr:hypothetical protein [Micromonospora sp. CPCC 205371]
MAVTVVAKRKLYAVNVHGRIPDHTVEHTTLATDAAVTGPRVGLGWLSDTGHWGARGHRYPIDACLSETVLVAELRAVAYAWRRIKPTGPVTLLLDSQDAIEYLRRWQGGDGRLPAAYRSAYRTDDATPALVGLADTLAGRPEVTVRWVEGHTGHILNEAADSLAKLGLRGNLSHSEAIAAGRVIAANRLADLHALEASDA